MSKHTPWTKEDAEKWAREKFASIAMREAFLAGLAKAAEVIEACPNLYQHLQPDVWCEVPFDSPGLSKKTAKLVGVRPIDGGEK